LFFLLFLIHPVAVITTSWMIQIKTLICFTFGIGSLITFLKGNQNIKWMFVSWLLFAGSILSKSASITLPLVLFCISFLQFKFKKIHLLIPFILISAWGTYRVLNSSVTLEGTKKASKTLQIKQKPNKEAEKTKPEIVKPTKPEIVKPNKPEIVKPNKPEIVKPNKPEIVKPTEPEIIKPNKPEIVKPTELEIIKPTEPEIVKPTEPEIVKPTELEIVKPNKPEISTIRTKIETILGFIKVDFGLIMQTINYYFWQVLLPVHNPPVRGINFEKAGVLEIINLIFMICLFFIFKKDSMIIHLVSAYVLLLPFLGLIPAGFMNVTWVSDQHLYLALPAFLAFWLSFFSKIRWNKSHFMLSIFVFFYGFKTYETVPSYKNQFVFFEKSLEFNPYNIPLAYNLALARIVHGEINLAYTILSETHYLSENEPLLKKDIYYPHLEELHSKVKNRLEKQ
jgi:hypothetical protein